MKSVRNLVVACLVGLVVSSCKSTRVEHRDEYVEVDRLLVVAHSRFGIIGVRRPTRAWVDTTEQGTAAASRVVTLSEDLGIRGMDISPSGSRLVFTKATPADVGEEEPPPGFVLLASCNIKSVDVGGGGLAELTVDDYLDIDPCFDRDGQHVLFASNRRRRNRADILRKDADVRSGIQDIYVNPIGDLCLSPSVAKDGTICFSLLGGGDSNEPPQIWTIGGPRGYPTQIGVGTQPKISPDGSRIVYVGADGNIWVMNRSGSRTQLTFKAAEIREAFWETLDSTEKEHWASRLIDAYSAPSWTSDGRFIVYSGMEGQDATGRPNQDIWIMAADGTLKEQLTSNGSLDTYPVCTPDQRFIFFVSNRGGRWAIWRMAMPDTKAMADPTASLTRSGGRGAQVNGR